MGTYEKVLRAHDKYYLAVGVGAQIGAGASGQSQLEPWGGPGTVALWRSLFTFGVSQSKFPICPVQVQAGCCFACRVKTRR